MRWLQHQREWAATYSFEKSMETAVKQHLAAAGGSGTGWGLTDKATSTVECVLLFLPS